MTKARKVDSKFAQADPKFGDLNWNPVYEVSAADLQASWFELPRNTTDLRRTAKKRTDYAPLPRVGKASLVP
jgi:hypothetical protein